MFSSSKMDYNDLSMSPDSEPFAPPRSRKTGLWADSTGRTGKSLRDSTFSFLDQDRLRSPSPSRLSREDSEDDIPLIPEIQEIQEDDYLGDISEPPVVPMYNITSFSQLNSDLKKYASFSMVDNVNLGLLTKHLYNEQDLKEGDNRWSWDLLFTEVSSELRAEWEEKQKQSEE
ncbi:intraflagellar transport protein 43 homolog isoform X1 [Cimex lectularius]|uniref:Intraflagellar transport protein 43 homolog n=1 Tax=Cimex lectularius TaxID=79782 RepID=A0A8I6TF60_CIMLE|nr:intraflagellar transport protein 43 homolog isoform X1 [Cimex lectularius]